VLTHLSSLIGMEMESRRYVWIRKSFNAKGYSGIFGIADDKFADTSCVELLMIYAPKTEYRRCQICV